MCEFKVSMLKAMMLGYGSHYGYIDILLFNYLSHSFMTRLSLTGIMAEGVIATNEASVVHTTHRQKW